MEDNYNFMKLFEEHNNYNKNNDHEKMKKCEDEINNLITKNNNVYLRINYNIELLSVDLLISLINYLEFNFNYLIEYLIKFLKIDMNKEVFIKLSKYYSKHYSLINIYDLVCKENKVLYLKYLLEEPFFKKKEIFETVIYYFYLNNDITKFFIFFINSIESLDSFGTLGYDILEELIYCQDADFSIIDNILFLDYIEIILQKSNNNFNDKYRNNKILHEVIENDDILELLLLYNFRPFVSKKSLNNKILSKYTKPLMNIIKECLLTSGNEDIDRIIIDYLLE